jgi:hypothetical protein
MPNEYGVLTLAIPKDYKKAIALSLTLKEHTPDLPISIVCPKSIQHEVEPYFDNVIIERDDLKGFEHKLYLDKYSPYQKTFFFDADIMIVKDITPIIKKWEGSGYAVRGKLVDSGISSFGLDREFILKLINKEKFSVIDGAGHAYFEKPKCNEIFELGRSILKDYSKYRASRFADEDAMAIAMTMLDIAPKTDSQFLGSPCCAISSTFSINTTNSECRYQDLILGEVEPYFVHFPSFVYPFTYAREMIKTFKRHDVKIAGIWQQAVKEHVILNYIWPLKKSLKRFLHRPN